MDQSKQQTAKPEALETPSSGAPEGNRAALGVNIKQGSDNAGNIVTN